MNLRSNLDRDYNIRYIRACPIESRGQHMVASTTFWSTHFGAVYLRCLLSFGGWGQRGRWSTRRHRRDRPRICAVGNSLEWCTCTFWWRGLGIRQRVPAFNFERRVEASFVKE